MQSTDKIKEELLRIKKQYKMGAEWKLKRILEVLSPEEDEDAYDGFQLLLERLNALLRDKSTGLVDYEAFQAYSAVIRQDIQNRIDWYLEQSGKAEQPDKNFTFLESSKKRKKLEATQEMLRQTKDLVNEKESYIANLQGAIETADSFGSILNTSTLLLVIIGTYHAKNMANRKVTPKNVLEKLHEVAQKTASLHINGLIKRLQCITPDQRTTINSYLTNELDKIEPLVVEATQEVRVGRNPVDKILQAGTLILQVHENLHIWTKAAQ